MVKKRVKQEKAESFGVELDSASENEVNTDSEIRKAVAQIKDIKISIDTLFQMVHDKGINVGMPRRIRDDIKELVGVINRLDSIWENKISSEKDKNFNDNITKLVNKGDVTSAFILVREELTRYKEDMVGVRMFLNMITFKLNHLNSELER